MKNPYKELNNDQLCEIIRDIQESKKEGKRIESFVPYAREIFKNLNGSYTSIPLSECIQIAQSDFYEVLCEKFLNDKSPKVSEASDASESEKIRRRLALKSGKEKIKTLDDLSQCFSVTCMNAHPASNNGKPMLYRRNDLYQWSKETFENGKNYFFVEPVDPKKPNGELRLSEPRFEYKLKRNLTKEEFTSVFGCNK